MSSTTRNVRPLDYVLAVALTGLGAVTMVENMHWADGSRYPGSTSWAMIPVWALATVPILWRRASMWAVLAFTAAALAVHTLAFGWEVRCGAGLPLAFALAYAVGRLMVDRAQSYAALVVVIGIQYLELVRDKAAGLGILPFTAVISVAVWGVGLSLQKRSRRNAVAVPAAAPQRDVELAGSVH